MTDDRSQRARAAAEAGTATREQALYEAWNAYLNDVTLADTEMPNNVHLVAHQHVADCRLALTACLAHLDELARLIAQRDGYADPRQGYLRELTEGDEPGVALTGWGSNR